MTAFVSWKTGKNFGAWHILDGDEKLQRTLCGKTPEGVVAIKPSSDTRPVATMCRTCVSLLQRRITRKEAV